MPDIQDAGCLPLGLLCLLLTIPLGNTSSPPGVSIISQKYSQKTLAEEDICHPVTGVAKNSMRLRTLPNSGLIVSPAHVFDSWAYRVDDLRCRFVIKAPKGEHLFAVIQSMSFRRNESGCIDYVKFRRKDRNSTDKFCDTFDRRRRRYSPDHSGDYTSIMSKNASFTFGDFDPQGEIETTIFVSKETLSGGQRLDLSLVYTPYKDCEKVDYSQYRTMRYNVCIWREYFCDGYTNCFAEICMDEDDCPAEVTSNGNGATVTIGAVTSILLCFFIFLIGLWICRRNKKLCWSSDCAGPSPEDFRGRGESGASTQTQGVASMIEVAVLPSALDKDLPPSYDSLFPEQANRSIS